MNRLLFSSLEQVPPNFNMINPVYSTSTPKTDSICQPSFDFFQTSSGGQVQWGSERPMKEVCPSTYVSHEGIPSHSLWNNLTKRKSMVIY